MMSIMTIRAPDHLQSILTQSAKKLGLARNALVLQILWEWTKRNELDSLEPSSYSAQKGPRPRQGV